MTLRIEDFQNSNIHPVLIIGMHRSGTSLLAKLLGQCGLFIGNDLQGNYESMLFMSINDAMFAHSNAVWNRPFGIHFALKNETIRNSLANSTVKYLETHGARYFNIGENGAGEFPNINYTWGWKDPRSTFTLPVWKLLFPKLKVIHILRHGVDVAQSVYQRDWVQNPEKNDYRALNIIRDNFGLFHTRPCISLEQAFLLWEEYVEKATLLTQDYAGSALQLKYEDLLLDPEPVLRTILSFCGISVDALSVSNLKSINESKAYAYKRDPILSGFADNWRETLTKYGY